MCDCPRCFDYEEPESVLVELERSEQLVSLTSSSLRSGSNSQTELRLRREQPADPAEPGITPDQAS